jgi:alpha-beta hydrolase superfamily lysophospholipase
MIAMAAVLSTTPRLLRPLLAVVAASLVLAGCAAQYALPGPTVSAPVEVRDAFVMRDGGRLPFREWRPADPPWAVVLALHGMNDSRDAYEIPGPELAGAGIDVIAPDQRGFGQAPGRGLWPSTAGLVADAAEMTALVRAAHPGVKVFLMGESMGAAVLMCLATSPLGPPVDGYVLLAPAVWGRAEMNVFLRATLYVAARTVPGLTFAGAPGVKITASSNRDALIRLSRDPLTLRRTRVDAIRGLVDLMDAALAAAPRVGGPNTPPTLFLYGGHDELVPPRATAATWTRLPPGAKRAFYPDGYHLLLRDLDRATVLGDVIAWMHDPRAPLPSGAEQAARAWLAKRAANGDAD